MERKEVSDYPELTEGQLRRVLASGLVRHQGKGRVLRYDSHDVAAVGQL